MCFQFVLICIIIFSPLILLKNRVIRLWKLLLAIICFGLLATYLLPDSPRCVKNVSRHKYCFSKIRELSDAIEMFNLENKEPIHELKETSIEELIKADYLKSDVFKPDNECNYKSKGDLASDENNKGFIYCTYHGDIDGYLECENFQKDEYRIPQSYSFEQFIEAKEKIIKKKKIYYNIKNIIFPSVLIVIIISLYLSCFFDKPVSDKDSEYF